MADDPCLVTQSATACSSKGCPGDDVLSKALCQGTRARLELPDPFAAGQGAPARHVVLGWRAHQIKDDLCLVEVAAAGKDWFSNKHLAKDAARTEINGPLRAWSSRMSYPTPHMSMAGVYFRSWSRSSGGRYHRVTTSVV